MRRWLLGLLLLAAGAAHAQSARPHRVVTAAEIAAAGATRLTDLFALLDDWHASTIEGFTYQAAALGLAPIGSARWQVMVDDQPVPVDVLDGAQLHLVPLHLHQVAYVEVYTEPVWVGTVWAPAGLLRFVTRRPAPGAALAGGVRVGNEVNDPGPFRYTGSDAPNVDRIGPHALGEVQGAAGTAWARLGAHFDEHHATDAQIRRRVYALYAQPKNARLQRRAAGALAGSDAAWGRLRLLGGATRLDDLRFFEPLGLEVPATETALTGGVAGEVGSPRFGLAFRAAAHRLDVDPRPNRAGLDFDWRLDRAAGAFEARLGAPRLGVGLGAALEGHRAVTARPLPQAVRWFAHGHLRLHAAPRAAFTQAALVRLSASEGTAALSAWGQATLLPGRRHGAHLTVAFDQRLGPERHPYWDALRQGHPLFLEAPALAFSPPDTLPTERALTADLTLRLFDTPEGGLTLHGFFRQRRGWTLADARLDFDPATTGFRSAVDVTSWHHSRSWGLSAEARLRSGALRHRLHYTFLRPVSEGDLAFYDALAQAPWHRGSYTVWFSPLDRFSLYARLRVEGPRGWPAYTPAAAAPGSPYPDRLPLYVVADLTARKRFWHDHLAATATLANVGNAPYRAHPAGALSWLTLYVGVQARFGTRPSP